MPKNVLISKIRCSSPNKTGSKVRNQNYLMYIATREGVDLTPLADEMSADEKYLKYIHERPKSHGLFGNLPADRIHDISQLSSDLYQISKKTAVYRAIISLDERDAVALGYTNKDSWQAYLNRAMPELSNALGIPLQSLQWVGAVHMEQKHPHVHCMFWRTDGRIQTPFIHTSKQNKCRELLSGIMFQGERDNIEKQKTVERDNILSLGKKVVAEELDYLENMTPGIHISSKIPQKIPSDQFDALAKELLVLFDILPKHGRLYYKFVPKEAKAQLDKISQILMQHKDIASSVNLYNTYTDIISRTYSASEKHSEVNLDIAIKDINKRLANMTLSTIRELIYEYNALGKSIDQLYNLAKETSANRGNQFAQYSLGKLYSDSNSELFDPTKAISYLDGSAKQGNPLAQYALGEIYSDFESTYFDINKAISQLELSASQENSFAQLKLGCIYLYGKGLPSNKELGMFWINKAIEQGNETAESVLKSYQTFEAETVYSYAYKLFQNSYQGLKADNQKMAAEYNDHMYRTIGRKAQREEALKNPIKHDK